MTKAEQIMALYAEGHTTRVIAEIVYGLDDDSTPEKVWKSRTAYVRVVTRQRLGTSASAGDKRWCEKNPDYYTNYRRKWRNENRERYNTYHREYKRRYRAAKALQDA